MRRLWRDRRGATAIEYGMIAAMIAVVIVVSVKATGTTTQGLFNQVSTALATNLR